MGNLAVAVRVDSNFIVCTDRASTSRACRKRKLANSNLVKLVNTTLKLDMEYSIESRTFKSPGGRCHNVIRSVDFKRGRLPRMAMNREYAILGNGQTQVPNNGWS